MWIKRADNSYIDVATGAELSVYDVTSTNYAITANGAGADLANGFATENAAQTALDAFMAEQGFEQIPNGN